MNPALSTALSSALSRRLGQPLTDLQPAGSGFTDNWRGRAGAQAVFLKLSPDLDRLQAEADGLQALAACPEVVAPAVLACGMADGQGFLAMAWLPLASAGDAARLGAAVAALHRIVGSAYGWQRDNYLGATPQENGFADDWADFFAERRLRPQLERAAAQGFTAVGEPGRRLLARLPEILAGHRPPPALLHGDLWHGNTGFVAGRPALFDPAVHYGDPECDLAMAALFGGFPPAFFAAHAAAHPPPAGWENRRRLYQFYHLLNHLNLFGRSYLAQVMAGLETLP